jgi:hypothetical protein
MPSMPMPLNVKLADCTAMRTPWIVEFTAQRLRARGMLPAAILVRSSTRLRLCSPFGQM